MFLHKSILVGMITIPLLPGTAMADPNAAVLELTIQTLRYCYEVEHKTEDQVAECMSIEMKKLPNPQHFQINLTGDMPGNIDLILYNQAGYTTKCSLYAGKKIELRQCMSYQAAPLSDSQELSINPPN